MIASSEFTEYDNHTEITKFHKAAPIQYHSGVFSQATQGQCYHQNCEPQAKKDDGCAESYLRGSAYSQLSLMQRNSTYMSMLKSQNYVTGEPLRFYLSESFTRKASNENDLNIEILLRTSKYSYLEILSRSGEKTTSRYSDNYILFTPPDLSYTSSQFLGYKNVKYFSLEHSPRCGDVCPHHQRQIWIQVQ